jgi:dTDP-4-dehydrorhamnose reductase
MRAMVTGSSGQLGKALMALLGDQVIWSGGRAELDVRDAGAVSAVVKEAHPDVVFNAAAYNGVDAAENNVDEALAVNASGGFHLARACREVGALLVHISSDYVFDGSQRKPYEEEDWPRPLSVYGVSKLAGGLLVSASGCPHLLVRTSGLFGAVGSRVKGGSFVDRIISRARAGHPLRVVADQTFSPTYVPDLADALVTLVERGARGLFHVANSGSCTWHELAVASLEAVSLRVPVEAIRSAELGAAARRPTYSVLSNARYCSLGLPALRHWREALTEYLTS